MFTFDSHYTAFSLRKCGGNDCRKPDPVGAAEALVDFFSDILSEDTLFFRFGRANPTPPAQGAMFLSRARPRQIKGPELRPAASNLGL